VLDEPRPRFGHGRRSAAGEAPLGGKSQFALALFPTDVRPWWTEPIAHDGSRPAEGVSDNGSELTGMAALSFSEREIE